MNLPLMIFAAGFGTRMRDLTKDRPKPMLKVGGETLIDRALTLAKDAGIGRIVVNTHYHWDVIEDHLRGRDVVISRETPDILDTGGGLRMALPVLNAPVVGTFNPDVIWSGPNPLTTLIRHWDPDKMDALLACVPLDRTIGRDGEGDFGLHPDGRISRNGTFVYGGAQIIKTKWVEQVREEVFSLNIVWDQIQRENRLYAVEYPGRWCDVGTPEGLKLANRLVAENV